MWYLIVLEPDLCTLTNFYCFLCIFTCFASEKIRQTTVMQLKIRTHVAKVTGFVQLYNYLFKTGLLKDRKRAASDR